jgi:hypothetical protein
VRISAALSGVLQTPFRAVPTYFTITVDTEEEWDWNAGWPVDELAVTNIMRLPRFQEACANYGAAVTYFANQAVFDDAQARTTLLQLAGQKNVELGMHIHPWNTPPVDRNKPVTARQTFLHNLPEDMIVAKLKSVYGSFSRSGLKPTSFRGGRYSSGGTVQTFLRKNGFRADASVVPYTTWSDDGAPDYRKRNLYPVRLPGEPPLWEIPLTLGFTRRPFGWWRAFYEFVQNSPLRRLRLIGIAERLGVVRKAWLNFEDPLGGRMLAFLKKIRPLRLPCICFTVHSSSLVAGKGPYTRTQADEDRLFGQLDDVLSMLATWPEFRPATVSDVASHLEEERHARIGN